MIYSKVLTNRNNLLGKFSKPLDKVIQSQFVVTENWDGSSHALTVDDINRKNKNTWSLLKLVSTKSMSCFIVLLSNGM